MKENEISIIREIIQHFFQTMTVEVLSVEVKYILTPAQDGQEKETVALEVNLQDPKVLIGQNGQTLFELQRLFRIILNKKLQKDFYLDLDINDYKKQKIQYLKKIANDAADQVVATKEEKALMPMPSYERRIIHGELALRHDVVTKSEGDGEDRRIVIKAK